MLWHFAAADVLMAEGDVGTWVNVSTTIISGGFAAVVAWYLLTRALPALQDKFEKSLEILQTSHQEAIKEQSIKHDETTKDQRVTFREEMSATRKVFEVALNVQQEKADRAEERRRSEDKQALDVILKHCEQESIRRDVFFRSEMSNMQQAIEDLCEIIRERRDRKKKLPPNNQTDKGE